METTKKESSHRQIEAAIAHLEQGELDCAITLAAAGEGILPVTEDPHIFKAIREYPDAKDIDLNLVINWLKHPGGPGPVNISEFEAALTIARAITKFTAVYHQSTRRFEKFLRWGHEAGYLPKLHDENLKSPTTARRRARRGWISYRKPHLAVGRRICGDCGGPHWPRPTFTCDRNLIP